MREEYGCSTRQPRVVSKGTAEQLNETFEGFVEAISFRSAQGMGTNRVLSEMVAEINARSGTR